MKMTVSRSLQILLSGVFLLQAFSAFAQVGVFQGTFDPPHQSHEEIARNAIETGQLKFLYILPMPDSPGKPDASPFPYRQHMVDLHFGDWSEYRGMDFALELAFREGYVQGLFAEIQNRHPDLKIFHVIGSDSVARFPETQQEHYALGRGTLLNPREGLQGIPEEIVKNPHFRALPDPEVQVSSTEIRNSLRQGEAHWALAPLLVQWLAETPLYQKIHCSMVYSN